jgi:pilus assembly protein CpaE
MASVFEATNEPRPTEVTELIPGKFEPAAYRGSDELMVPARATQSESSFIREVAASAPHVSIQEARASLDVAPEQLRSIAPVPRITIHAFCENHEVISILERAAGDRHMSRTKVEVFAGGIRAGVEFYRHNPAPNLIIVESRAPNDAVLAELNELAEFCDPGTRVMVIGYSNDIRFYRELMQRGVNEYVVAPINAVSLVAAISSI